MKSETVQIVVVGAGNVGLQTVLTLALVQQAAGAPWRTAVVDFDRVEEKDTAKGYHRSLVGGFKAEAAVEMVRLLHGEETSSRFLPVVAAAQSVPGLVREAAAIFNGTDSVLDAAFVSEEARNGWEARLSTGIFGETAVHTVEVMPEGYTLGETSYDDDAWADAARHECRFGIPDNAHAGVPQPCGTLAAALAVHLFLGRSRDRESEGYKVIRVKGDQVVQWSGSPGLPRWMRTSREIPLSYDATLARLWAEAALRLKVAAEEMRLAFPVPIVTRQCGKAIHGIYQGFERHPVSGRCSRCGEKTFRLSAPREVGPDEVAPMWDQSLRRLHTPAGLRFTAWTRSGGHEDFHLPFRLEDVPGLPDIEQSLEALPQGWRQRETG